MTRLGQFARLTATAQTGVPSSRRLTRALVLLLGILLLNLRGLLRISHPAAG